MLKRGCRSFQYLLLAAFLLLPGLGTAAAQKIPAPEEILGFKPGADYHLATYEQAVDYFKALEKASPRIKIFDMGQTEGGRTMIYAVITSEENMAKLDRYKEISRRLALARGLSDQEAHQLAAEGKAIVMIGNGMHATECAPAQGAIQFAHDLVASEDPELQLIRQNTILIYFFPNPDGMTMVSDWYTPNVGTPFEVSPMPWLYNKYVGHDINRDSYMNNLKEVQNITRMVTQEWFPVILYDHHQSAPFPARIWIPPAAEPTNQNLHPLFIREKNLIGTAMGYEFDREGKPGAISRFSFDFIYPGYEDSFGDYFNVVSIMTETAHYRYATPHLYTLDDFPEAYKDFTKSVFYPSPWKGGWWRLKDGADYANTGSKAVLETAARYREMFLYDRYQMGKDTIAKFEKAPPYAYVIPQDQWDPPVAARMLENLAFADINVSVAKAPFVSDGVTYPAGTWVVPMAQPFARFVKTLFEVQHYPDLSKYPTLWQGIVRPQNFSNAYLPPYDMAGWTLPYQMGVKVVAANAPLKADLERLKEVTAPAGKIEGNAGAAYLISPKTNNSFIALNRIFKQGGQAAWAKDSFQAGGREYSPGTMIVSANSVPKEFMSSLAADLHLDIGTTGSQPQVETYKLKAPRVGLYKSYVASMDEGWTRWLFEHYEFPYESVFDADIRAGSLEKRFDVLVIPSNRANAIVDGQKEGTLPPQYAGGITEAGVKNLRAFVEQGGTLVTLRDACFFALQRMGIPVGDALKGLIPRGRRGGDRTAQAAKFACPGSLIRMDFNPKHPVAYGMPEEAAGMFYGGTAFDLLSSFDDKSPVTVVKYPGKDLLMSGFLQGEQYLENKAAVVDAPLGKGRVVLLGFAVQNRAQPHATFKLLFNSLLYGAVQQSRPLETESK